jgi:diguanylate cyclase (GGDEF)-like protein
VIPPIATLQVLLAVVALRTHGDIYLYFAVLVAVFIAYAFRSRRAAAFHFAFLIAGVMVVGIHASAFDPDAIARSAVAAVSLFIAAVVVVWLRETLELRERTDPLTGLANRRALMEALELADRPMTLALFDLDGFKRYNDQLGHAAGDALLERVAARLMRVVDGHGEAFRLGGDELCVLINDRSLLPACCAALREGEITASYGAASLPEEADTPSAALSLVDSRMYAAKRTVRSQSVPFMVSLQSVPESASASPSAPATDSPSPSPSPSLPGSASSPGPR